MSAYEDYDIRASYNFCESATTIKKVKDVKALIDNNEFQQMYRHQTLISEISILEFYFSKLIKILNIPSDKIEKLVKLNYYGNSFEAGNYTIRLIYSIAKYLSIDSVIINYQVLPTLQTYINTRNMIIHNQSYFDEKNRNKVQEYWYGYSDKQKLIISENMIDDVYWFLNDHVKTFTNEIDSKVYKK